MSGLHGLTIFVSIARLGMGPLVAVEQDPATAPANRHTNADRVQLISLAESLKPLRDQFDASSDRSRLIALLSPTCPVCLHGARSVLKHVVQSDVDGRPLVYIVWMHMLPGDSDVESRIAAKIFRGHDVVQFHDPAAAAARAFAEPLEQEADGKVWDVYLYYKPGSRWQDDAPPDPAKWLHQMDNLPNGEAPQTGEAFDQALQEIADS